MSHKVRLQFDKILDDKIPAIVSDEVLHGGAPRRRLLWGNFQVPTAVEPRKPLDLATFLEKGGSAPQRLSIWPKSNSSRA